MRKRLALVAVSVMAAVGAQLAMASPAGAEIFGSYRSEAECERAKVAHGGHNSRGEPLYCSFVVESPKSQGVWRLTDNRGSGA